MTNPATDTLAGADSLAEIILVTAAKHGAEVIPELLAKSDSDKMSLREAAAELEAGGALELASMVRVAVKLAKRKEPEHVTARKRGELERHRIMVRAHCNHLGLDPPDEPIPPGKSYRMRFGRKR